MPRPTRAALMGLLTCLALGLVVRTAAATTAPAASAPVARYQKTIKPFLIEHCHECHADGSDKGKVAFDAFASDEELVRQPELWARVLKNVRAGLMPPKSRPRPRAKELRALESWIKRDALAIDPQQPDPGAVTLRRLNRTEYKNTIADLMGYDFKVEDELPPDDTGYGFDNIGDVLSISPMLLEKYMRAAEEIVGAAVPRVRRVAAERTVPGRALRRSGGGAAPDRQSFYEADARAHTLTVEQPGRYRVTLVTEVVGQFDFDPGRLRVRMDLDGKEALSHDFGWQSTKLSRHQVEQQWEAGPHELRLELQPLTAAADRKNDIALRVVCVELTGPLEEDRWGRPKGFDLFFTRDPPEDDDARRAYADEVLTRFATRAFRRPVDRASVARLVAIAEATYRAPGKRFEDGIAQAMIPVLASPRFLFRTEETISDGLHKYPLLDEWALASRLSYFMWSTMPDEELLRLAAAGRLRQDLRGQVLRMLRSPRSAALIENFGGQWLQFRDVEGIDINARVVLGRDGAGAREPKESGAARRPKTELDKELRRALREETAQTLAHVVRGDRGVLELIDADYTFLNERLAQHYGIEGVTGPEMRRVPLPKGSPRGGVLTQGAVLIVTSNPTRTSPVKRGLFVLDNILGIPPPPPPADVPALEESEKVATAKEPTLREVLAIHRDKPLCHSCHNRMDPLGLALENFNALGMWRSTERGQPIEASGKLITGEAFTDVRQVKRVIATAHRLDFYRCLTEKLLTYALGRGLDHHDVGTVDEVVARLDRDKGRFGTLLSAIVESAPFQQRRSPSQP